MSPSQGLRPRWMRDRYFTPARVYTVHIETACARGRRTHARGRGPSCRRRLVGGLEGRTPLPHDRHSYGAASKCSSRWYVEATGALAVDRADTHVAPIIVCGLVSRKTRCVSKRVTCLQTSSQSTFRQLYSRRVNDSSSCSSLCQAPTQGTRLRGQ